MGKRKLPWQYANAQNMKCGVMVCVACGKKITDGDYRYREDYGDRGYHAHQHRECVPLDQQEYWSRQDESGKLHIAKMIEYREACKEFRDKWSTVALDEEIEELEGLSHDQ